MYPANKLDMVKWCEKVMDGSMIRKVVELKYLKIINGCFNSKQRNLLKIAYGLQNMN